MWESCCGSLSYEIVASFGLISVTIASDASMGIKKGSTYSSKPLKKDVGVKNNLPYIKSATRALICWQCSNYRKSFSSM